MHKIETDGAGEFILTRDGEVICAGTKFEIAAYLAKNKIRIEGEIK